MATTLQESIEELLPEIIALRHELHTHPEIRFEEVWTSDRIATFLTENGIEHKRGYAKGTGIVAWIKGGGERTVALRTDMDALDIQEETGLDYTSTIPQRMHACGHDGHMANLCGVAKLLNGRRDELKGTVKFIFQPAEELAAGGRYMVEEGAIADADAVFGLHCWPTLPVGSVGFKSGAAMASADMFIINVTGKGCHAADPGAGVDPILVAAHITTALQSIVSRETNPWDAAVVTVARINSGFASNVIPETAIMEGTFRALSEKVRLRLRDSIERIATLTALAHRARAEVIFSPDCYPLLYNDEAMTKFVRDTAESALGSERLIDLKYPTMGAEDFAFYLQEKPGSFFFIGNNPSDTEPYPNLHSPHFNFSDDALPTSIELMSAVAIRFLAGL